MESNHSAIVHHEKVLPNRVVDKNQEVKYNCSTPFPFAGWTVTIHSNNGLKLYEEELLC